MQLNINGVAVTVSDDAAAEIVRLQLVSAPRAAANTPYNALRIGVAYPEHGGVYAGVMRGLNGSRDYCLFVGPAIDKSTWHVATATAAELSHDGHHDYTLPFRAEQALQFANVPDLFEKEWYWSCEQPAADSDDAWGQDFGDGGQDDWGKYGTCRARAVRRSTI